MGPEPVLPLSLHLYPLFLQRLHYPRFRALRLTQAPLPPPLPTYPGKEALIWTSHGTRTDRRKLETDTQIHTNPYKSMETTQTRRQGDPEIQRQAQGQWTHSRTARLGPTQPCEH